MHGRTTLERIARAAADFDVHALSGSRLIEARSLAVGLVGEPLASLETMAWVYDRTKLGLLGVTYAGLNGEPDPEDSSPLCGLLGVVPLTVAGNQAVLNDLRVREWPEKTYTLFLFLKRLALQYQLQRRLNTLIEKNRPYASGHH